MRPRGLVSSQFSWAWRTGRALAVLSVAETLSSSRCTLTPAPVAIATRACSHVAGSPPPSEGRYAFPMARALRYVRAGRYFYRCHDGQQELWDLLARSGGGRAAQPAGGRVDRPQQLLGGDLLFFEDDDVAGEDVGAACGAVPAAAAAARGQAVGDLTDPRLAEAERFIKYHCHHVKVAFKRERAAWTARASRRRRPAPAPPLLLSGPEVDATASYLLHASLLLHLTSLYGVGEQYLEDLLEICLSCSIFLSQQHNAWRHARGSAGRRRGPVALPAGEGREVGPLGVHGSPTRSLRFAVVHYTAGVQRWGLLEHTHTLFPLLSRALTDDGHAERSTVPCGAFGKLLQAYAGLLLSLAVQPSSVPVLGYRRHDLQALLGGAASQQRSGAVACWFGLAGSGESGSVPADGQHRAQQRALQLLPQLWLAMVAHQLHVAGGPSPRGPTLPILRDTLLPIVSLFTAAVPPTPPFWALTHVLYRTCGAGGEAPASPAEAAALMAAVERVGLLPSRPPAGVGGRDSGTVCQDDTRRWLTGWWRTTGLGGGRPSAPTAPVIRGTRQLYAALVNIPLCLCPSLNDIPVQQQRHGGRTGAAAGSYLKDDVVSAYLGSRSASVPEGLQARHDATLSNASECPASAADTRSTPAAVRAGERGESCLAVEGLDLVNALLFRALLQWQAGRLLGGADPGSLAAASASARDSRGDCDAGGASTLMDAAQLAASERRLWAYTRYVEELAMVLEAATHVRALHERASGLVEGAEAESAAQVRAGPPPLGKVASAAAAVAQTAETAMRALAEQLAGNLFPQRAALDGSRSCAPIAMGTTAVLERALLGAIDEAVTSVLGGDGDARADLASADASAGRTPQGYRSGLQALLRS